MDQIIENPGFQHLTEKILLNLPFKDVISLQLVNKTLKEILDDPMFWIKKWILKGLSKKNKDDWIKAIQLTKNTKLAKIIILYAKKVLHRNRLVDFPCHIDEKTVDFFSKFSNETTFQNYFEHAFEDFFSIRRFDAGSIQICIALVKNPNVFNVIKMTPMLNAMSSGCNDIVKVLAPFIGDANAQPQPDHNSFFSDLFIYESAHSAQGGPTSFKITKPLAFFQFQNKHLHMSSTNHETEFMGVQSNPSV